MFIELSKVRKRLDIDPRAMTRLEQWLVFLAADSDEILEELRMEAHEPELDQALSEIEYAALSKRDQLLYQARMDAIRDHDSLLIDRQRRGKAKGKAEMPLKIAISLLRDPAKDTKSGRQENRLETPSSLRRLRGGASMLT
jgi:predicted transposase/invertase (TIGR01784 family)